MKKIKWSFTDDGVMKFSGKGRLSGDFYWLRDSPCWKLVIGEGITEIGGGVFSNFTELKEVVLPNSLVKIGSDAFESCEELKHINFPDGLEYIGRYAFEDCYELMKVVLPKGVTLDTQAFSFDTELTYK